MRRIEFSSVLDLFLPRICPGCGQILSKGELELCVKCLSVLPETGFYLKQSNPVSRKFIGRFDFEEAAACFYFQKSSVIQSVIHQFKYKNKKDAALFMGKQMGLLLQDSQLFQNVDGIVPVPLFSRKRKMRGYNQSELLGVGMSEELHVPVYSKILQRITQTQTQTKLNAVQRWQNVKEAFALSKREYPEVHHLMLVDDVVTSGSTLEACARTLSKLENIKISMVALAVAIH